MAHTLSLGALQGSAKATATVTAIIDGTGSIGAAVGPFLAGSLLGSRPEQWRGKFVNGEFVAKFLTLNCFLGKLFLDS